MTAYARGNAANKPAPPSTSQVSLPSQIGATEFIATSRSSSVVRKGNKMPMPSTNPSSSTYMKTPKPMIQYQMKVIASAISVSSRTAAEQEFQTACLFSVVALPDLSSQA